MDSLPFHHLFRCPSRHATETFVCRHRRRDKKKSFCSPDSSTHRMIYKVCVSVICKGSRPVTSVSTLATGFRCFYFLQVPYIFRLLGADLVNTSHHRWSDNTTSERDTDTRCYHASNAVSRLFHQGTRVVDLA